MEIVRHRGKKIHVGCGGEVVKGRCLQCGGREEKRGLGEVLFGKSPLIEKKDRGAINREEHRKRLRERRDIFK